MIASRFASFALGFGSCALLGIGMAAAPRWLACPLACPPGSEASQAPTPLVAQAEPGDEEESSECGHTCCGGISWSETDIDEVPEHVLDVAGDTIEGFDVDSAEIAKLGPVTLYAIHGTASNDQECTVILTAEGTVLQADAAADERSLPTELVAAFNQHFPGATIRHSGITQTVTYWANITTAEGKTFSVSFDSDAGLAIVDAEDDGEDGDDGDEPMTIKPARAEGASAPGF